jgi:hypothetical protein
MYRYEVQVYRYRYGLDKQGVYKSVVREKLVKNL